MATVIVEDNFDGENDPSDTPLEDHTADQGAGGQWPTTAETTAFDIAGSSSEIDKAGGAHGYAVRDDNPSTKNYLARTQTKTGNTAGNSIGGVGIRHDGANAGSQNVIEMILAGDGDWNHRYASGGSYTNIDFGTETIDTATYYNIEVYSNDDQHDAFITGLVTSAGGTDTTAGAFAAGNVAVAGRNAPPRTRYLYAETLGRATKNTDAYPLGVNVGMSRRMPKKL